MKIVLGLSWGRRGHSGVGMETKSTGIAIKSSVPKDLRNAEPYLGFEHVKCGPACCEVGPAGLSVTEKTAGTESTAKMRSVVSTSSSTSASGVSANRPFQRVVNF